MKTSPLEKLKQLRESENLSQVKYGKKFGLPTHTIKNIESGLQQIPDNLALALEKEYGIPFKWWKTGEGEMLPNPEEASFFREIREMLEGAGIPPETLKQILQAAIKEPELMSFAAKAVRNRDRSSLERFYKLLGD